LIDAAVDDDYHDATAIRCLRRDRRAGGAARSEKDMADRTRGVRVRARGPMTDLSVLSGLLRGSAFGAVALATATGGPTTAVGSRTEPTRALAGGPRGEPTEADQPQGEQAIVMAIVRRAQDGDAESFGDLYDRYAGLVFRYVYYRGGDRTLAEDFTSETFLRALRRIATYTWQGRDIGAWLVTIARNLMADHFKSSRFRLEMTTDDLHEADRRQEGPEGAVVESLLNAELLTAVKQLGSEQQECIVLRFLQGLSVAETARVMGKNDGAIKAMQYRAVRALARRVSPDLLR
jgi:RNA polymerase sigma-70 factor (ECF subfamily)